MLWTKGLVSTSADLFFFNIWISHRKRLLCSVAFVSFHISIGSGETDRFSVSDEGFAPFPMCRSVLVGALEAQSPYSAPAREVRMGKNISAK